MGIDWLMLMPKNKEYISLPKKGEWCNELWKIWDILQNIDNGESISFVSDNHKEYGNIINNLDWKKLEFNEIDWEYLLYDAEDIVCGGHTALYHATRTMERQTEGKNK